MAKPAWTVGLSILCVLFFLGEGGWLRDFLQCRPFVVLSRLTFCSYLIHASLIYWLYDSLIAPTHYTDVWYASTYIALMTSVTFFAAVVHLVVERPVSNLDRLF